MLAPRERSLEDFKGDAQAMVADFITTWNLDLPPALAARNQQMCDTFINVHGRTRFAAWFRLTTAAADRVIAKAFEGADAGDGWRETIEDLAGFKFAKPLAPESAELVVSAAKRSVPSAEKHKSKLPTSLSGRLTESGLLVAETLPEACFDVIETVNPQGECITEDEVKAFTDAVLEFIAAKHGDWKVGMALARIYGKQAKKKLPNLPDWGATPGNRRNWGTMIFNKCKNRFYVCLAKSNQSHSNQPHSTTLGPPHRLTSVYTEAL